MARAARCAAGTRCGPTSSWLDKLRVWFKPPGWRPADVATKYPKPAFQIERRATFDPAMSRAAQWLAGALFVALLGATSAFLWTAHTLSLAQQFGGAGAILLGLCAVGAVSEGKISSRRTGLARS